MPFPPQIFSPYNVRKHSNDKQEVAMANISKSEPFRRELPTMPFRTWDEVFEEYNIDPKGDAYREVYGNHDRDGNGGAFSDDKHDDDINTSSEDKHDDDINASSDDEHDGDSEAFNDDDDTYPFNNDDDSYPPGRVHWDSSGDPCLGDEIANYVSPRAWVKLSAYYREKDERIGQALMHIHSMVPNRNLPPLDYDNLKCMLGVANLNSDEQRGIMRRVIARDIACLDLRGIGIWGGEVYRIIPGNKLMVEPPRPRNMSDIRGVTTTYAGMRKTSWSHIQHAQFKPFIFIDIGVLQIADIGILQPPNSGRYKCPSFKKMRWVKWLQTDFNVVMKINADGKAGGIYIIWDFSPKLETKKHRQRLYSGNTEWGYFHIDDDPKDRPPRKIWGYCKEMRFSVAKIADQILGLQFHGPLSFTEIYTHQIDIHYTVKKPDGTIDIYTGPGYDPPEDYFLMFSETESLQPSL
ncbi:MAG: hypothetical protein M1839_007422 [Geoglossum umbratile]|nr:MAG: hypothetical protein M1839_007422 [Geoglossum umbratile]